MDKNLIKKNLVQHMPSSSQIQENVNGEEVNRMEGFFNISLFVDALTRQNIGGRLLFEILTKQALFWYKKYIAYSFGYSRPTDQVKSSEW